MTFKTNQFVSAHSSWSRRWWSVPCFPWILPGGFPCHSFHRMQRCPRNLPLFRKQIQLLADYSRTDPTVCRTPTLGNPESGTAPDAGGPVPGVHEELVVDEEWMSVLMCSFGRRSRDMQNSTSCNTNPEGPLKSKFSHSKGQRDIVLQDLCVYHKTWCYISFFWATSTHLSFPSQ